MPTNDPALQARYRRAHYERNKDVYIQRNYEKRRRIAAFLKEYKEARPCEDCGLFFPAHVLDLDHRPGEVKVCDPAKLINTGSWAKVHAELEKCDVVCANCHRVRTHERYVHNESLRFDPDTI